MVFDTILLDPKKESWEIEIDQIRSLLGAPNNPQLFPPHYIKATLPKIGGKVALFVKEEHVLGAAFLFPRSFYNGNREYTLRFHRADPSFICTPEEISSSVSKILGGYNVVFYDPSIEQKYQRNTLLYDGGHEGGRADLNESLAIREIQKQIWGSSEDFLYPADIHSEEFRAGTSLVARYNNLPIGFLFGFYKFNGLSLPRGWEERFKGGFRLESQLLGVLPSYRSHGIGFLLKKLEAEIVQQEGICIINWTVDPLQYANAVLNFGRLRSMSFDFFPDYYDFRNELNQVSAARLGITWLVNTTRVKNDLSSSSKATVIDLNSEPSTVTANENYSSFSLDINAPRIAIEVPSDWTAIQHDNIDEAIQWRDVTSRLFQHYLGYESGKYIVTGVGFNGDRKYLIADQSSDEVLESFTM